VRMTGSNQTSPRQPALASTSLPLIPSPSLQSSLPSSTLPLLPSPSSLQNSLSSPPNQAALPTNLPSPPLASSDILLSPFLRNNLDSGSQNFLEHMIRIRDHVQKSGNLPGAEPRGIIYQPIPRKSL
jgi:hypothetical protein